MHVSRFLPFVASLVLGVPVLIFAAPSGARADLSACNDIFVDANATCTVVPPSVTCEGMCTPVTVQASCHASLAADCRGGCDKLPSVDCSGTCSASCMGECTVDPGKFDCDAYCQTDCSGRCSASCSASDNSAECEASCKGSCGASCHASCDVEAPSAACDARCEAGCKGSCEVDPNIDCQVKCQAEGEASCEADVEGGCKLQCQKQEGALFCDGNYVGVKDDVQSCVDALKAELNIHVEAEGSSSCDDAGTCSAEGSVKVNGGNCSVSGPGAADGGMPYGLGVLGLIGLFISRRKRA